MADTAHSRSLWETCAEVAEQPATALEAGLNLGRRRSGRVTHRACDECRSMKRRCDSRNPHERCEVAEKVL